MTSNFWLPGQFARAAIKGAAPAGYNQASDIITATVDGFDLNTIWNEYAATVALANAERQTLIDLLTFQVTDPIERVPQITSAKFERASEYGEPRGIRPSGGYFNLGYDFDWYDLGARFTWKFLANAPRTQVDAINSQALEADNTLMFGKVMATLFDNTNRTADINDNPVPVYALYNNDGTIPPKYKSNSFDGTHNHYLVSGAATVTSGDLDDLYEHLRHHGYGRENGIRHVLLVNRREAMTIRTFRVATGATYDFIPSAGTPAAYLPIDVTLFGGSQPPANYQGLTAIGSYGELLIVEEDLIPVGYMALIGTGGRANLSNPVGIREHPNAALRGLRLVKGATPDYPLIDSFYQRAFGTGIRQRGGAVVMQIKASGSYDIPSGFSHADF